MEHFVIIVNGLPLTTITKRSILDVAAVLDTPLILPDTQNANIIFLTAIAVMKVIV